MADNPSGTEPEVVSVKPVETTPENLNRLHQMFQMLDPNREGIGLENVRTIFPKQGWHTVLAHVNALVDAGRLKKRAVTGKGGMISHEVYTWQEV